MSAKEPVRLLILETSLNRAEELIVLLRTSGHATRAYQVKNEADLNTKLSQQNWDLLLGIKETSDLKLQRVIEIIKEHEKDVPTIMIADNQDLKSITEGLKIGALDVVLDDDPERFKLVIQRELNNLTNRRRCRRAEKEVREIDRRNQLLLVNSTVAVSYVHEGMHIYTNGAYGKLFGYEDPDDFIGIPIIDLIATEDQEKFKSFLKSLDTGGSQEAENTETEELSCLTSDNSKILSTLTLSPATYDGEYCTQIIFKPTVEDPALDARRQELSSLDTVTGLYNRTFFVEKLDLAVDQAREGKQLWVLFYISVDKFASIRTASGISNADLVLANIAAAIRQEVDENHIMARFGDDVFTILYKGSDKKAASVLAEQIAGKIEHQLIEITGKAIQVTLSIGLSLISENSPTSEEIISRAHKAGTLIDGGNGFQFHVLKTAQPDAKKKDASSDKIKQLVLAAIDDKLFKLLFQPIINLHGDEDEQYEVLLRLLDKENNELGPAQFLDSAETVGMLEKIDRWVILQSIKMLSSQRAKGNKTRLFINITYKSMADDSFLPWMSVALKAARLPSDAIIFQIHENDATTYIKHATKFIKGLSELHCKTSINHFGCSLNPLNLLQHLTTDYVKLDDSFAQLIEGNKDKQQELVQLVTSLQSNGVLTAISGVESPLVMSTLWEAGINYIQGFYISPPMESMDYDFSSEDL
ncbi:MAG: EAL domain-containing protein [Pseudomonadales bacterium]|nr:EAL domain-containing protein [Pseudomonadales bacterium]